MIKFIIFANFFVFAAIVAVPQDKPPVDPLLKRAELLSPWNRQGTKVIYDQSRRHRTCLDLVLFEQFCNGAETLSYGNRFGVNWDIFTISGGRDSQSRMIDLGKRDWNEKFSIPEIEPWSQLKPGETRSITVNTSGADGRHGADGAPGLPGRNADGSFPIEIPRNTKSTPRGAVQPEDFGKAPVNRQVTSTITISGKSARSDKYDPFIEVRKGHMYLIRVVDTNNDHYILLHVDDLTRGEKVSVSYISFSPIVP